MDTSTKTHISIKLDTASVAYPEIRQAILKYTGLVGATRQQKPTPIDISGLGQAEGEAGGSDQDWPQEGGPDRPQEEGGGCPAEWDVSLNAIKAKEKARAKALAGDVAN